MQISIRKLEELLINKLRRQALDFYWQIAKEGEPQANYLLIEIKSEPSN